MIRLQVDPSVYAALKIAVPKTNKAQERLNLYVSNLEKEINYRLATPRPVLMLKNKQYFASLTTIQEYGGKIESLNQIRTHKWLEDNNLALIVQTNPDQANNLTGEISKICFTGLVTVIDDDDLIMLKQMTRAQRLAHLQTVPATSLQSYRNELDEYNKLTASQIADDYDLLEVNQDSVIQYINDLIESKIKPKDRAEIKKALDILRISQVNNSIYPQKKKLSSFGRTYYEKVSIQSVNKNLRRAILKDCYEYDVKSCVITWKYAFADLYLQQINSLEDKEDAFLAINYFISHKKDFFTDVNEQVFNEASDLTEAEMNEKIKLAMTALTFGARLADNKWINKYGEEEHSSINDIFDNYFLKERQRFLDAHVVQEFKRQQSLLDKFIIEYCSQKIAGLSDLTELKTDSGRRSDSKTLAWLYQHAETIMMNLLRAELKKSNIPIRANIHDAIVIDQKIKAKEKSRIELFIRDTTGVTHFELGEKHYV